MNDISTWWRDFIDTDEIDRRLAQLAGQKLSNESWLSCWKRRYVYWKIDYKLYGWKIVLVDIKYFFKIL